MNSPKDVTEAGGLLNGKIIPYAEAKEARERQKAAEANAEPWPDLIPFGRAATPPEFPTYVLPPWVAEFVRAEAATVQTPADMPAMFALGALAGVTGGYARVQAWEGFVDSTNLYVVCALPASSLKSVVHKHVTAPILKFEEELQKGAQPEISRAVSHRNILEKRLKSAEDAAAKAKPHELSMEMARVDAARRDLDESEVPVLPRVVVDDCTPEQLKSLLTAHKGRLAMMSAESALFGNVASTRYSSNPNIEAILSAHPGDPITVDRRGREEKIKDPRLTICIAVQPSVLRKAYENTIARDRGLFARFLYSMPKSNVGYRDLASKPLTIPAEVSEAWDTGVREIARVMRSLREPMTLRLSPEAQELFIRCRASIEPRRRPDGDLFCVDTWAGKLDGTLLRLAGLLHIAWSYRNESATDPVSADAMRGAIELITYFIEHAKIAFDEMDEDEATADARKVLAWIRAKRALTFSRSDIRAATTGRFSRDHLSKVLGDLIEHGYLRERSVPGKGRTAKFYDVNPAGLA